MSAGTGDDPASGSTLPSASSGVNALAVVELPPLPKKTILVTGGSGFIGGQLVIHLANYYSTQPDPYRYDCTKSFFSDLKRFSNIPRLSDL